MRCINKGTRLFAACMAAVMIAGPGAPRASAAAPKVSVDESVYINLDYYGEITDTSIVKGCSLNGNKTFTDYGSYASVTNMSNHTQPQLAEDHVSWTFEDTTGRFYYECKPKNALALLPWSIDVSYSLNGVPARAEELAGASGLVQVDIDVKPNSEAKEYYQNNMMLIAATLVNLEDVNSFRADGAQMQVVGSQKAALFMAMPGEETSFSYQIGSDSFETTGTIFLMVPATMAQFSEIAKLKDAKERIEDASDALSDSMDIIFNTMESMVGGLNETQQGLNKLNEAREILHESSDGFYNRMDKLNTSMEGLSTTLRNLAGKLDDGEDSDLEHIGNRLLASGESMDGAAKAVSAVNNRLYDLRKSLLTYSGYIKAGLPSDSAEVIAAVDDVNKKTALLASSLQKLEDTGYADQMGSQADDLKTSLEKLSQAFQSGDPDIQEGAADQGASQLGEAMNALGQLNGTLSGMSAVGNGMIDEIRDLLDTLNVSGTVSATRRVVNSTGHTIDQIRNMSVYVEDTLKDCDTLINDGTKQTLEGLQNVLGNTANGLAQTGELRNQKNIIKDTIKNEWDRLEDDLGILNIDTEAEKISFTSDKNPVPDSIQIIMRTEEISIDDDDSSTVDAETATDTEGFWDRIQHVFQKIWNAILSIFE